MYVRLFSIIAIISILLSGCFESIELPIFTENTDIENMALIPAGYFNMGQEFRHKSDHPAPYHQVYTDAFYISKCEVTIKEYYEFMEITGYVPSSIYRGNYLPDDRLNEQRENDRNFSSIPPSEIPREVMRNKFPDDYPAVVTWKDALAYAEWKSGRLPTEAEWEKAARGGIDSARYSWGNETPTNEYGNFSINNTITLSMWVPSPKNRKITAPVGHYKPNGYDLYDVTGNYSEWCMDYFSHSAYTDLPEQNPYKDVPDLTFVASNGLDPVLAVVIRGGAFSSVYSITFTDSRGVPKDSIRVGRRIFGNKEARASFRYAIPIGE